MKPNINTIASLVDLSLLFVDTPRIQASIIIPPKIKYNTLKVLFNQVGR